MNVPKHVVQAVNEALRLLPPAMDSKEARVMLYAIRHARTASNRVLAPCRHHSTLAPGA